MDWTLLWRRFKLLLWKHMVMRRRNWPVTCIQILVPPITVFFIYLLCIYAKDNHSTSSQGSMENETSAGNTNMSMSMSNLLNFPLPYTTKVTNACVRTQNQYQYQNQQPRRKLSDNLQRH